MQAPKGQNQTGWKPRPKPRNRPECAQPGQGWAGWAQDSLSPRDQGGHQWELTRNNWGASSQRSPLVHQVQHCLLPKPSAFLPVSRERLPQLQIPAETLWSTTKRQRKQKIKTKVLMIYKTTFFKVRVDLYSRICLPCSGEWQLEGFLSVYLEKLKLATYFSPKAFFKNLVPHSQIQVCQVLRKTLPSWSDWYQYQHAINRPPSQGLADGGKG